VVNDGFMSTRAKWGAEVHWAGGVHVLGRREVGLRAGEDPEIFGAGPGRCEGKRGKKCPGVLVQYSEESENVGEGVFRECVLLEP